MGAVQSQQRQVAEAGTANFTARQNELTRQQTEANRIAQERKSDTVRKADQELGTIRATQADMGASRSSYVRLLSELGGVEGTDLSRIEMNRQARVDALQTAKTNVAHACTSTIEASYAERSAGITSTALGFVGSGLRIGLGYYYRKRLEDIAQGKQLD